MIFSFFLILKKYSKVKKLTDELISANTRKIKSGLFLPRQFFSWSIVIVSKMVGFKLLMLKFSLCASLFFPPLCGRQVASQF